jgi:hypothetical protein
MDAFLTSSGLVALITLTFLEIVLGVDNHADGQDHSCNRDGDFVGYADGGND